MEGKALSIMMKRGEVERLRGIEGLAGFIPARGRTSMLLGIVRSEEVYSRLAAEWRLLQQHRGDCEPRRGYQGPSPMDVGEIDYGKKGAGKDEGREGLRQARSWERPGQEGRTHDPVRG